MMATAIIPEPVWLGEGDPPSVEEEPFVYVIIGIKDIENRYTTRFINTSSGFTGLDIFCLTRASIVTID